MKPLSRNSLAFGVVALLLIAFAFTAAGHPIISPEAFAALGAVPFVMGDTQSIAAQISSFEAKRVTSMDRMTTIMAKAAEDGRTLDEAETQEYDGLAIEVKAASAAAHQWRSHVMGKAP